MRSYPFIAVGLIVVFVAYILYLVFIKKDIKSKLNTMIYPSLFFIATWVIIYFAIFN